MKIIGKIVQPKQIPEPEPVPEPIPEPEPVEPIPIPEIKPPLKPVPALQDVDGLVKNTLNELENKPEEAPTYVDSNGKELFGIPELGRQIKECNENLKHNSDRLNKQSNILKMGIIIGAVTRLGFLGLAGYGLYAIMKFDLFTKFIEALKFI